MKRLFRVFGLIFLIYLSYIGLRIYQTLNQARVFDEPVYETVAPQLPLTIAGPETSATAVLVFSKTQGFRHSDAIAAANTLFKSLGEKHDLQLYFTENGAIHNTQQLAHFKLIIWNNNTGDVLNTEQRQALKSYIHEGGHWLGIHGAGGTREYQWQWYPQELLRAQFKGHPLFPQFQTATIVVEDQRHPAMRHLPQRWQREEEWYSFNESPRARNVQVLASLDESTYNPKLDLKMKGDHPLIWTHKVGKGIVFYSALGHNGSAYAEPAYRQLLENTLLWLHAN